MKNKQNIIWITFFAIFLAVFAFNISKADGYDIYVDESYDEDDSDGSSDKPYKEIEKAIEESDSEGKKIYIKNGTYDEVLTLSSGVELTGEDKDKTIIKGSLGSTTIVSKGDNIIRNLTISGGNIGITFEKKGSIESCVITGVSKNAINLTEKSGKVIIKNSSITGNGKGVYAQSGSSFSISGNKFETNKEEGIDIRERVNGSITGNYIAGNGEGGIEIVVGSSDVSIKDNTIKKNSASGIAAQFYSQAKKVGEIDISKNNISYNKAYGIVCKAPSGGNPKEGYYDKSIDLRDNKIEHNKKKAISGACDIVKAISEEEKRANETIESPTALIEEKAEVKEEEKVEKNAEQEAIDEETQKTLEKEVSLNRLAEYTNFKFEDQKARLSQAQEQIKRRSKFKSFLWGVETKDLNNTSMILNQIKEDKCILEYQLNELKDYEITDSRGRANIILAELEKEISENESKLAEEKNKFSILGSAIKIFNSTKSIF